MIVNILNHSNTHKKKIPNFCQITPTSYLNEINKKKTLKTYLINFGLLQMQLHFQNMK